MKARLFLDTNIMLDLLGERVPHYDSIAKIATLSDMGEVKLTVSALAYSTIFYVLSKYESSNVVKEKLRRFKIISEISDLTESIIEKSLASDFTDFEDALQYHCALKADCNVLITRNGKDFRLSKIPVMTGEEFLASLKNI